MCVLARLAPIEFNKVCPLAYKGKFEAGSFDECELCKYFGTICFRVDESSGIKQIILEADNRFVFSHDPIKIGTSKTDAEK